MIALLTEVHTGFERAVHGLAQVRWTAAPVSGGWSPAEILEHTLLVERGLLANVKNHLGDEPIPARMEETDGKDAILRKFLPDSGKAQASEKNSTFLGLEQNQVASLLKENLLGFSQTVEANAELPLRNIAWQHGGFGLLNASQWLLYIPLHSQRHLNQLRRIIA
jgi:hypothetical protein